MTDKQKPAAYMHNLDPKRIVSADTVEAAIKDGGAMLSSLLHYTIPLWEDIDGEVVVTWDESMSRILAVTRQDSDGRIISVIAEVPSAVPVSAEPVGYVSQQAINRLQDGRHADVYPTIEELKHEFFDAIPMAAYATPVPDQAQPEHCNNGCQGKNCSATEGREHSNECIVEAAESQGWEDSPEAEAARLAMKKPDFFTFVINGTHRDISETEPPHDSYDEGSLIPLYKKQPVSGAEGLPPLPRGISKHSVIGHDADVYTDVHMVDYARAALTKHEPRTDADRAAALIVEKLAEIIPLKDTLKATASGKDMVEYFKSALDQQEAARKE